MKSKHTLVQNTLLKLAIVFKEHAYTQYIIIFAMEISTDVIKVVDRCGLPYREFS